MPADTEITAPEKYGLPLKFEPEFQGPRKKRSCTDVICLFLFLAFIIVWCIIGWFAFKRGNPESILKPSDSEGRKCGLDSEVLSKPFLLYFDIYKCADPTVILNGCNTPQVCIEKCPEQSWDADDYITRKKNFDSYDIQKNLICVDDKTKNGIRSAADLSNAIERMQCAKWYPATFPTLNRCLPVQNQQEVRSTKSLNLADPINLLKNASYYIKNIAYSQEVGAQIFDDLTKTWRVILFSFAIAIVISLLYISLLRWVAGILTWLSILAIIALTITGGIFSYKRYEYLKANPPIVKNKMIVGTLEEWSYSPELWIVLTVVLGVTAAIVFLLVIFLRNRISVAITLIKEGSKAVSSIITSLFFPLLPWLLQCIVTGWVVVVLCYLVSIGEDEFRVQGLDTASPPCVCTGQYEYIRNGDQCVPEIFRKLCTQSGDITCTTAGCHYFRQQKETLVTYFEVFNIFGFFWGIWFVSGFSQMILAGAFASWYWTYNKRKVPFFVVTSSLGRTVRYHLGTVAFGSLIIAICSFIRAVIEYTQRKLKKFDNALVRAIFCCCKCFFWCLERFLKFVSKNAYIMCAIHGKNFCSSAGHAFNLLMRNTVRVVVLDKVADFLFFIGKLVITACMVTTSYYLFLRNRIDDLHYNGATPLLLIAVGTYIIASIFFGVYSMAVDTLFLCFLEDCERNDGSVEKPYFMSKNLMTILGKKNKMH